MRLNGSQDLDYKKRIWLGLLGIGILIGICLYGGMKSQVVLSSVVYEEQEEQEETILIDPTKPMIAITFDDGPSRHTDKLLEALEDYGARATFFMLGQNIKQHPNTVRKMKELGCEIGNHTINHVDLSKASVEVIEHQVEGTNEILIDILGEGATLVRPPYGAINENVYNCVKYPLVLWSVDTMDWYSQNVEQIVTHTMMHVQDGDVVLMHDIYDSTVDATIILLERLTEQGYQFVTVSELAQMRKVEMVGGVKYFRFKL